MLTDELALQRTRLANERTWLAYVRTALTLLIAGLSFIQFFTQPAVRVVGWIFIPLGVITAIVGRVRYRQVCKRLNQLR